MMSRSRGSPVLVALALAAIVPLAFPSSGSATGPAAPDPGSPSPADYRGFAQIWTQGTNGNQPAWASDHSPDGKLVAIGGQQSGQAEVVVRNATTGASVKEFEMQDHVYAVRFSPDGTRLAMGGKNRMVEVANTSDWSIDNRVPNIQLQRSINDLAWSEDSRYLFNALGENGNDGYVLALDSQLGYAPASSMNKQFAGRAVFSIDSRAGRYAVGIEDGSGADLYTYAIPSGTTVSSSTVGSNCLRVRFDPAGTMLAVGRDSNRGGGSSVPPEVDAFVWDTKVNYSGGGSRPHVDFSLHPDQLVVRAVAFSPDGLAVVSGGSGTADQLRFWDASNGSELAHHNVPDPRSAAFSPGGSSVIVAHASSGALWGDNSPPTVSGVSLETPERKGGLFIPKNLRAELARWVIGFTKDMDTSVAPTVGFGDVAPFDRFPLRNGSWRGPREWAGEYDLRDANVSDGVNDLTVDGAKDSNGNTMAKWQQFEFMVDRLAPVLTWSSSPGYWQRSSPAGIVYSLDDPLPASGVSSRLHEIGRPYGFSGDNATWTNDSLPAVALNGSQTSNSTVKLDFAKGEGHYCFDLPVWDRSANRGPAGVIKQCAYRLGFDATPPRILRLGSGQQWSTGNAVDVPYEVSDGVALSRLDVSPWFSTDGTRWDPLPAIARNLSGKASNGSLSVPAAQEGWYRFDGVAWDESGLASAKASGSERIDRTPPESGLAPLPSLTNDPNIVLKYAATDAGSGLAFVDIDYRMAGGQWARTGSGGGAAGQVNHSAPIDGVYEFRSVAEDVAGNRESPPAANDTWVKVDTAPPEAVPVDPLPDALGVPPQVVITSRLSESVDQNSIVASLSSASGPVAGSMRLVGLDLTFTPAAPLETATTHTFEVQAFDLAGNRGGGQWSFKTAVPPDGVAPKVEGTLPEAGTVVAAVSAVSVSFDEPMSSSTAQSASVSPGAVTSPALSADLRTLTFGIDPVTEGETYTVVISSASARDASGERLDGNGDGSGGDDFRFSFQVSSVPGGSVRATVRDREDRPVAGAAVHLLLAGERILTHSTDAKGEARFADLIPGVYGVEAVSGGESSGVQRADVLSGQETRVTLRIGGPLTKGPLDDLIVLLPFVAALTIGVALAAYFRRRQKCPSCRRPIPSRALRCPSCGIYLTPQAAEFFDRDARVGVVVPASPPPEIAGVSAGSGRPGTPGSTGRAQVTPVVPQRVAGGPQLTGKERRGGLPAPSGAKREVEVDESASEISPSTGPSEPFDPYKPVVMRVGKAAPREEKGAETPSAAPGPTVAGPPGPEEAEAGESGNADDRPPPPPPTDEEGGPGEEDPLAKARRRRRDRLARGEG